MAHQGSLIYTGTPNLARPVFNSSRLKRGYDLSQLNNSYVPFMCCTFYHMTYTVLYLL